jgi:outer membrane protein TolC
VHLHRFRAHVFPHGRRTLFVRAAGGGRGVRDANVRIANADYTAAVAAYRQTVLTAMEEVENGITGLASLDRAVTQADASVKSAQDAFDIATARYRGGVDTYLEMITAQQVLLSNQRQAVQIQGQQFATAVYLVKALGGGWSQNSDRLSRRD